MSDSKPASKSSTIWSFGILAIGAIVTLILHYTGVAEVDAGILGGAFTALGTSILGIILRLFTKEPIDLPASGSGPSALIVLALLFAWLALPACGGKFGESAEKAGWCAARCVSGCAASWIGDLLDQKGGQPSPATEVGSPLRHGARVYYHVEGEGGQPLAIAGRLQGAPIIAGRIRAGYVVDDAGGPARLELLSPTPRLYCASAEEMEEAQPAPPGFVPKAPPRSRAEFVERFGALPAF